MSRIRAVAGVCALALVVAGCSLATSTVGDIEAGATPPPADAPSDTPQDAPSTPTPTPPAAETPSPAETPTPTPTPVEPSPEVAALQERLTALGYYVSEIDGLEGPATRSAVMAFQKVNGLGADGVAGPITLAALDAPVEPELVGGPADRVEVDLTRQVLHLVVAGARVRTVPTSSGSGEVYETASGGQARALTPVGTFRVERQIRGERKADLGILYDPKYFFRGWAIHGSNHVPAHPASHGCIRVTRADMLWLFDRLPIGTPIIIHGGTHTFVVGQVDPGTNDPGGDTEPAPTDEPTDDPTATPSEQPSPGSTPTSEPTSEPTSDPSPTPSESGDPSEQPSGEPSEAPTDGPSSGGEPSESASPSPTPSESSSGGGPSEEPSPA